MENSLNTCPSLQEIEQLAIDSSKANAKILAHFDNCPNCKCQYTELVEYYQILQNELAAPVANSVINFLQEIEAGQILLSVIRLYPVTSESEVHPTFRSELIYRHLQDASFVKLPEIDSDEIFLRLLQDPENLDGCVVLLAKQPAYYRNIKLFFPKLNLIFAVNANGFGKFDPIDVQSLADQIVKIVP